MFECPKCHKVYKKNGYWLQRHMIEKCHVKFLRPNELISNVDQIVDLVIIKLQERGFTKLGINHTDPIERIKLDEEQKYADPILKEYRNAFKECIIELKEVLRDRRVEIDQIELAQIEV